MLGPGCTTPHRADLVQLTNADFELPLDSGWTVINDTGGWNCGRVARSDTLGQPRPGFAAYVYKDDGRPGSSLSQTVPIETLGQVARFWARFRVGREDSTVFSCEVTFSYLDDAGTRLARTSFVRGCTLCDLRSSDSVHIIPIADTAGQWAQYSFNLQTELDSALPRVDQSQIRRLRVELLAQVEWDEWG